ncbi:TlpA disulfide reductase family protein [Cellulophaga lytica]|uniref:TlpA family protein disulfide reductase n=1 Tax=Cellulophaga lytica TaxID=979 RepID=UPI0026E486DB|nr:TlpA disulfide reductase family protein [Cellulophaga lytica]MDO6853626.1 TlpA disulfide reductase family protein [Cellulophaga lytica]
MKHNKLLYITTLLLLFSLLFACKKDKTTTSTNTNKEANNSIVLIFNDPPVNWLYKDEFGGTYHTGKYEVSYVDDNLIPRFWMPDYSKKTDTLIINTKRPFVETTHKYEGDDFYNFVLKKGDTVIINYNKKKETIATVKNKLIENNYVDEDFEPKTRLDSLYFKYQRDFLKLEVKKTYLKNRDFNSMVIFDSVIASKKYSSDEKKFLLRYSLEKITDYHSVDDTNTYFKKFKEYTNDSVLVKYIKNKYNIDGAISKKLALADFNGNTLEFKELINSLKGKIVYVDFWASWCIPCRRAFPYSKKLAVEYKNKDVAFVYLSVFDKQEDWKIASEKEKLKHKSFFVKNSLSSELMSQLNIKAIPRYLMYNKKGQLIHKNAPGPNSKEIRVLLTKELEE